MQLEEVFIRRVKNEEKLLQNGFMKQDGCYVKKVMFHDQEFYALISVDEQVHGHVYDAFTNEEYTLVHAPLAQGAYSGQIKEEYREILEEIAKTCFDEAPFTSPQANRIAKYIEEKYQCSPDFLFKDDTIGVFKNKAGKWFGLIMHMSTKPLDGKEVYCDVLNVKSNDIPHDYLYPAYHMNKKKWLSLILDGRISDLEVIAKLDESYALVDVPHAWILPANVHYFDVEAYFDDSTQVEWHHKNKIQEGDLVFIYMTAPYSCLMYKCKAISLDEAHMILQKEKKYPRGQWSLDTLRPYGIKSVRSGRRVPYQLLKELE